MLTAIGVAALLLGVLVYLADRPPGHAAWVPHVAALAGAHLFGAMGQWLPSFVHPFAFALFTAATYPPAARPAYGACAGWWAVNIAVEVAQHVGIGGALASPAADLTGHAWLVQPFNAFIVRGTFDVGDLVAATLGALAAAGVLGRNHHRETCHAQD